jgi:hypothetical protein
MVMLACVTRWLLEAHPTDERGSGQSARGTRARLVVVPARGGPRLPQLVVTGEAVEGRSPQAKHFWAFPVYNYHTRSIQVLEIKQQTIMRAIEAFVKNPKWGNPQRYDLMIEKVKTGSRDWDVEYHVIPEPPTQLDAGIAELAKMVPVRLEALYEGGDPFAVTDEAGEVVTHGKRGRDTTASRRTRVYS